MKARLCIILSIIFLLSALILPASAGEGLALQIEQLQPCEPGQSLTMSLSLPDTAIAGGFLCIQYDASLLTLTNLSLADGCEDLTLTYAQKDGKINVLLDAEQNVPIFGTLLYLSFQTNEEIQPGTYPVTCTVPDPASFYALEEDGSTRPLDAQGCSGYVTINTPVLPPCPVRYLACQETAVIDGKVRVRLCALVPDGTSLSLGSYGFTLTVTDPSGTRNQEQSGSKLTEQIDGGSQTYTAKELGGSIYTLILEISAQGKTEITLAPYAKVDGQTLYGGSYTVTYLDGIYVGTQLSAND